MNETDLIKQLQDTGKYKVIKKLRPQEIYYEDDGSEKKIAIFLDIESTGTNIDLHEIIELAMVKFEYNLKMEEYIEFLKNFQRWKSQKILFQKKLLNLQELLMPW